MLPFPVFSRLAPWLVRYTGRCDTSSLLACCLILLAAGCSGPAVLRAPRAESGAQLPLPYEEAASRAPASLQPPLTLAWKEKLHGPLLARPAVRDGTLYIPMSNYKIFRVEARNGARTQVARIKGVVQVTPALRGDVLYLSLTGQSGRDLRECLAFDLRRNRITWRRPLENGWSSPALVDDTLYMGAEDGGVYALSTETGETRWRFMTRRQVRSSPVVADGTVFVGSDDNHLYALDAATGTLRWSYEAGGSIAAAPVVADTSVYAASYDASLYCLDAGTGRLRWRFSAGGSLHGAPAVEDGRVFLGSNDRNLYCLDAATGALIWRFETEGVIKGTPFPVGAVVYAGSSDNRLYAVDIASGAAVWRYKTGGSITITPVTAAGMLLVGAEDRYIYAFTAAPTALAPGRGQ